MTQSERILALLQHHGSYGVSNFQLNEIAYRYAARIHELRKDGHDIRIKVGSKPSERIYTLVKQEQMRMYV